MLKDQADFGKAIVRVKQMFFDRAAVVSAVDKATLKVLNHIGGLIRLTARRSIRDASAHNQVSKAGKPPLSHCGLLKNYIWYSYDKSNRSVVVGPVALNAKGKDVPHTLEYGGYSEEKGRRWTGTKNVFIKPRPYMAPALDKHTPAIAAMWKNSISKT